MKRECGEKIWYKFHQDENECPTDAVKVSGSFSGPQCLTNCPIVGVHPKVGSLSCVRDCPNYAGSQNYGVATGSDGKCGAVDSVKDIYCRNKPVTMKEISRG